MKKYTPEQDTFMAAYIPGHSQSEIQKAFAERFGITLPTTTIRSYKKNHNIKSGTKGGGPKGVSDLFPRHIRDFIRENNTGKTAIEMTELLNTEFGRNYTTAQIKGIRARMHIKSGLSGCYKPGNVPANKGKKGTWSSGSEKSWFKKGHVPYNKTFVGDERITSDGYIKVKIAEPKKWRFKHVMIWEKNRGPVPEGFILNFRDGNPLNCVLENLTLVTRSEHSYLNKHGLRTGNPEITDTAILLARVAGQKAKLEKRKAGNAKED